MVECLNSNYSTTRLCYKLLDDKYLDKNGKIKDEYKCKLNFPEFGIINSKIPTKEGEKFDTYLFLPEGKNRKGEGGLRTKGYFKKSFPDKPLISIVTVVYNGEKFLEKTIKSVINQTYDNVEYVIIDGGSTDGTLDIIKKYENYIDYWVSEKDKGIYDAMNKGIDVVTGKWINFMNAGDRFYNEKVIESVFSNVFYKDIGFIYGNHKVVYPHRNNIIKYVKAPKKINRYNLIYKWNLLSHQAIFYKTSLHKKFKFNLCNKIGADFEVTYNMLNSGYKSMYKNIIIDIESAGGISDLKRIESIINWWNSVEKNNVENLYFIYLILKEMIKNIIKNIIGYK